VQALGLGLGVLAGLARYFAEEGPTEGRASTAPHWTDVPGMIGAALLLLGGLPTMLAWSSRSRTGWGDALPHAATDTGPPHGVGPMTAWDWAMNLVRPGRSTRHS
jgi:hypothetical protein